MIKYDRKPWIDKKYVIELAYRSKDLDSCLNNQILYFTGTEMDFVEDKLSAEFVFNNPNIKGTCGCGESFSIWL